MLARSPHLALLAGMALVPFVALWPLFQANGEAYAPGFNLWSARLLWATIFACVAAVVARRDAWLGAAVAVGVLDALLMPPRVFGASSVGLFVFGALALVWVRTWPARAKAHAVALLGAVALLEALVMLGQFVGINPLWAGWTRVAGGSAVMTGTLGNTVFASTLVTLGAAFIPWWPLLIVCGAALVLAQSKIACLAFALACVLRYAPRWTWAPAILTAAVVFVAGLFLTVSGQARLWVWQRAVQEFSWYGSGLGLAPTIVTPPSTGAAYDPAGWQNVHSDALQWARERGAFGVALLGGWLGHLRVTGERMALAAFVALVALSLVQSPFHLIATGLPSLVILGLATSSLTSDPTGA